MNQRIRKVKPRTWVYLFKPQLAPKVRRGKKRRTIRAERKDGLRPKVGDLVSLREWTGLPRRSKQRVLCESVVTHVCTVRIDTLLLTVGGLRIGGDQDDFAKADGFETYKEMTDFFRKEHSLPFKGVLIEWR